MIGKVRPTSNRKKSILFYPLYPTYPVLSLILPILVAVKTHFGSANIHNGAFLKLTMSINIAVFAGDFVQNLVISFCCMIVEQSEFSPIISLRISIRDE